MEFDGFKACTLDDLAIFRNGKSLSNEFYTPYGKFPVFGANGQIARADQLLNRDPVVVIGRVGAYCGSTYYIGEPSWVTDNAIIAQPKEGVDCRFLYYRLLALDLRRTAVGSAQPLMTQGGLKIVRTVAPPLPEQRSIAHILGTLDDKIELNRRTNETLEAMAKAIFNSWFVDYDPVRAKAEGRKPTEMSEEIAKLFPDSFEDSELGKIPKGWGVKSISEIGHVITGKTPPTRNSENYGGEIPFIRIPDMQKNVFIVYTEKNLSQRGAATQPKKELPSLSVCVSCIATPGLVAITSERSHTNQQINSIICNEQVNPYYIYLYLKRLGPHIITLGSGGTATLNLNRGNFAKIKLIVPGSRVLGKFNAVVSPLFERILLNAKECHNLASIRDALLPKLLSGKIRVKDLGKFVEKVK